jgi:UDP-glucose 4-epimerase
VINLGTGKGVTVREMVEAFEKVYGQPIHKAEKPPRPGDVAGSYANANKAKDLLGWEAQLPIEKGIEDALRWGNVRKEILGFE